MSEWCIDFTDEERRLIRSNEFYKVKELLRIVGIDNLSLQELFKLRRIMDEVLSLMLENPFNDICSSLHTETVVRFLLDYRIDLTSYVKTGYIEALSKEDLIAVTEKIREARG